jgi:osmoprotectant transport system permease protein
MDDTVRYFADHRSEILRSMLEHITMVGIAMVMAIAIGVPLGVLITRWSKLRTPVLGLTNVVQTIPSLALFGFLLPLPWLAARSERVAITALALYALLPIISNTYAGIAGIDPAVREVGRGMGMTDLQLLIKVELPLAMGTIMAGIRVATVIAIGVATIAAAVGAGGLGEFVFRGLAMVDNRLILAGAIPAAVLALAADFVLGLVQKRLQRYR